MIDNKLTPQDNNDIIKNIFSFCKEQACILYSIEKLLIENDISKSKTHIFAKESWLKTWIERVTLSLGETTSLFKTVEDVVAAIKDELKNRDDICWLKMALLEASIFVPYYPLDEINKDSDFEKSKNKELMECVKSYKTNYESLDLISDGFVEKGFSKNCANSVEDNMRKLVDNRKILLAFGGAAIGAAVLATLTAGVAGPIAVALVGSSFPGLSGAALTSACLATLGGGSLAVSGLGMAGGTALITGGGAILGLIGGGSVIISAEAIRENSEGKFDKTDVEAMTRALAKLVAATTHILSFVYNNAEIIAHILNTIRDLIRVYREIFDDMSLDEKPDKSSISNLEKIIDILKKAYFLIKDCQKDIPNES